MPYTPATLETFTIRPAPLDFGAPPAADHLERSDRFPWPVICPVSAVTDSRSMVRINLVVPALLTNTSRRPNESTVDLDESTAVVVVRHVRLYGDRLDSVARRFGSHRFGGVSGTAVVDGDRATGPRQRECGCPADSCPRTGDDRSPARQFHGNSPVCSMSGGRP